MPPAPPTVLLRTVHGSHLYGTATPTSDHDTYTVTTSPTRRPHQHTNGTLDTLTVPLGVFVHQCHAGVPQALEALFSPLATPGPLDAYRAGFRADTRAVRATYTRTIRAFATDPRHEPGTHAHTKRRRHAARLTLALLDLLATGRTNPRLTPREVAWCAQLATEPDLLAALEAHSGLTLTGHTER